MKEAMKPLIAIVGNTGVGKSQFAVELAKALNGEVINGDAMQMYQGLDIITNKHPVQERENVPHHLLGFEPWNSQLTVQDFEQKATSHISRIHSEGKLPVLVGGTHYYIQSLIAKNSLIGSNSIKLDEKQSSATFAPEQQRILSDPKAVENKLSQVDPVILSKFHPNDTRRLRRALEVWYEFGEKPSEIYEAQLSGSDEQRLKLRYRILVFWVWCNRNVLTERLDQRVDKMISEGLMAELDDMYKQYDPERCQTGIWQVLGFRQFLPYLQSRTEVNWKIGVDAMQSGTRQYAKKQTKWIRNKLGPFITSLGGEFALVDSSNLASWNVDVIARGVKIATQWLNELPSDEPLVPDYLSDEIVRKRQSYGPSQWVRHRCEDCSNHRGSEVVMMGDDEWDTHVQSKAHKAALNRRHKLVQ